MKPSGPDPATIARVSRAGSRFALFMLFASLALGVVLTAMSAAQLRQVGQFTRQILLVQARGTAVASFLRWSRQPDGALVGMPDPFDETSNVPAEYVQLLDGDGRILAQRDETEQGSLVPMTPAEVRAVCDRGFDGLRGRLSWRKDGTVRVRRALLASILEPVRIRTHSQTGKPVMEAVFALPMPEPPSLEDPAGANAPPPPPGSPAPPPAAPPPGFGPVFGSKGRGMGKAIPLIRQEALEAGAPCLAVRVGIDASVQQRAVRTHGWMLVLAILSTLLVVAINIVLWRTLRQRERAAEDLQRARRVQALGEMAATLAHEIKNPVGAIRGYAQLMQEMIQAAGPLGSGEDADRAARAVDTIVRESTRLEDLVHRTLEYARPGELRLARVDLRAVADSSAATLAGKARKREVGIVTDHASSAVEIEVDRDRIEQVLANLMDNAIEASPAGSTVVVRVAREGSGARIEIIDRGKGIAADRIEKIFLPFETDRPDGTGLGLAVSRSIVEAHNGSLSASSPGPGKGATFTVGLRSAPKSAMQ